MSGLSWAQRIPSGQARAGQGVGWACLNRLLAPSEPTGPERAARPDLPAFEARHEPARALLRGAVGEGVWHDVALALALQAIIADGLRGVDGLLDVALLQGLVALVRVEGPDAGEAIGHQFDAH